jgi:hypothetical protein
MTPQEKANDLFVTFRFAMAHPKAPFGIYKDDIAKQCALLTVDEIIESRNEDKGFDDTLLSTASGYWTAHPMYLTYWEQVKQEIEKL